MQSVAIDLEGKVFGRLTVLGRAASEASHGKKAAWTCRCACGQTTVAVGKNLRKGITRSCGCLRDERFRQRVTRHGLSGTRAYVSWCAMKTRCYNSRQRSYANYGGRGIRVCDRWRDSFEAFLEDMGPCPAGSSLDRLNVDGHYEPGNVRWANALQQQNNTTANHRLTFNGETHTIAEWERAKDFSPGTLKGRIQRGWSVERALQAPVRHW